MEARFHIEGVLSAHYTMIEGHLTEGEIKTGYTIAIPLTDGKTWHTKILGIEHKWIVVKSLSVAEQETGVALCVWWSALSPEIKAVIESIQIGGVATCQEGHHIKSPTTREGDRDPGIASQPDTAIEAQQHSRASPPTLWERLLGKRK